MTRRRFFEQTPASEVDEELAFHFERRVRDYVARGMDPDAARAATLARLGDVAQARRVCAELLEEERRAARRRRWFADLGQDVRYALRSLRRAPLFTTLAIATLALGIGANTAVFGVVRSVLLDALPYADAERLVRVHAIHEDRPAERDPLSAGVVRDLGERARSLSRIGYFFTAARELTYTDRAGPQIVNVAFVGGDLLGMLGVPAARGRTIVPADVAPDAPQVAMLSDEAWRRLFASDPGVLGRTVTLDGYAPTIVGVLPPSFIGPMGPADLVMPGEIASFLRHPIGERQLRMLGAIGRLAPGATAETARREIAALGVTLAAEHRATDGAFALTAVPLRDEMIGAARTPLLVVMASAGLVLLIACANLAGALVSRALARRKELAIRAAIGAGDWRIVRQLLTESVLLAIGGGLAGLALAVLALAAARRLATSALPRHASLSLDAGTIAFAAGLALLTGIAFGLAPAIAAARESAHAALQRATHAATEARRTMRLRGLLVAGQVALSLSLVSGAGLLGRSLWAMMTAPLGFEPRGVLTVPLQLPRATYPTPDARAGFVDVVTTRLRATPGVRDAAITSQLPTPTKAGGTFTIDGAPFPVGVQPFVHMTAVSDGYFRTMRIALRRGRALAASDRLGAPDVVVVSESMARRFWPAGDAIGARIRFAGNTRAPWNEVVGIVADVRDDATRAEPEPTVYTPYAQTPGLRPTIVLRGSGDALALHGVARRVVASVDATIPTDRAASLDALVANTLAGRRLPTALMSAFGALAVLLAAIGIHAMLAAMATAREREFGVRIALGSTGTRIAALVLRQVAGWMALGLVGGAIGVVLVTRALASLLYGVTPSDPVTIAGSLAIIVAGAVVAVAVPVARATRADPLSALR